MSEIIDNDTGDEDIDVVDWWASRVVDREVEFADVPIDLRSDVQRRASDFGAVRTGLSVLASTESIDDLAIQRAVERARKVSPTSSSSMVRRIVGPLGMAAALIAVVAIGISAIGSGDSGEDFATTADETALASPQAKNVETVNGEQMSQDSSAPMATGASVQAASSAVVIADMVELTALTADWWTNPPPRRDDATCPQEGDMHVVDIDVVFAGTTAEIHLGSASLMVYSLTDCTVLAGITT